MALLRKLFYRKPPDGLFEICERVYVFDSCFTTDVWEEEKYKVYVGNVINQLREHYPDASTLVFNFRDGGSPSLISDLLSEYDMTIMDYPRHYEGCPLLPMEVIHHFLKSSESWLSLGEQNVLLMHCERGGWPVLAFMLAALLIYRRYYSGEQKTLDMVYKQAPRELLHLLSPLNPFPSQLRYLQYVSRRNVASEWPPLDRALTLDCIILRMVPNFDGAGGCRPIFRIYGKDPFLVNDRTTKVLFSTLKKSKTVRHYKQVECELVKIDINCHIQGDVVLECINLHEDMEWEEMMFRVMFNTAFIRSNILILNRDEIDTLWDAKDQFPKDFRVEVLLSEMDAAASIVPVDLSCFEEKDGLPLDAFATVQEFFSNVDWLSPKADAMRNVFEQISISNAEKENLGTNSHQTGELSKLMPELNPGKPLEIQEPFLSVSIARSLIKLPSEKQPASSPKSSGTDLNEQKEEMEFLKYKRETVTLARPSMSQLEHSFVPSEVENNVPSLPVSKLSTYHHSDLKPTYPSIKEIPETYPKETSDAEMAHPLPLAKSPPSKSILSTPSSPLPVPAKDSKFGPRQPPSPHGMPMAPLAQHLQDKVTTQSGHSPPTLPSRLPRADGLSSKDEQTSTSGADSSVPDSLKQLTLISEKNDIVARSPPPPPPPLPPLPISSSSTEGASVETAPPPPSISPSAMPLQEIKNTRPLPPPPPIPSSPSTPLPTVRLPLEESAASRVGVPPTPPPPVLPPKENSSFRSRPPPPPPPPLPPPPKENSSFRSGPPPPPPPKFSAPASGPTNSSVVSPPPPPPLPSSSIKKADPTSHSSFSIPSAPPPPVPPSMKQVSAGSGGHTSGPSSPPPPSIPPPGAKGKSVLSRTMSPKNSQKKKLKPLHWLKLNRAVQGSLWAEAQKSGEVARAPEIDMKELESLFSAALPGSDQGGSGRKTGLRASMGQKSDKVQLIEHRRAYNCEIMLSKVKISLHDLLNSVLALEDSALDVDQVENLIKFCPTKEEMEVLKGYKGDKNKLGRCEQFFLELMQVPRIESKLRVFSFKIQFNTQVSDLRKSLNTVNSAADQIRGSTKLKRIMQTILSLGNALNQGTARGSAIGFRLDSLLKLTDTRARDNKMTLMHYLCKVLADKLPELLDFGKDLSSLEPASKIQIKFLAEEMQAISKGLEKIVQELSMSETDGPVSDNFHKALKEFLCFAEGEVRSLASLYSGVGRNVDALILYFGEDPARCPFEQVISTLLNFVRMFNKAHEENCKQLELERKKAEKETATEKFKITTPEKDPGKIEDLTTRTVR